MKNLLLIIAIIFSYSCTAQEYPLNTDFQGVPSGSYIRDTKNELNRYTGIWKASYNNQEITLELQKVEKYSFKFLNYNYYGDTVFGRYTVKDINGNILQTTFNKEITNSNIEGSYILYGDTLGLSYSGGDCSIGSGIIYLQYLDGTHLKWNYTPEDLIFMEGECPQGSDLKVYLPKAKDLVFTKQ
ncbi:TPA: DUF6705 family protein [Elizabethkingia anophelis]